MEIRPILPMAIGMLSLTMSLLEFSSDFFIATSVIYLFFVLIGFWDYFGLR